VLLLLLLCYWLLLLLMCYWVQSIYLS
jgi:hypothetical protein